MADFLTGNELNTQLGYLFEEAEDYLLLVSPYIKLHDRYISELKEKKNNYNLNIVVVFGKNDGVYFKSMKQEDFDFFKEFPNIEIRYENRLHAKYYANQNSAILTSMNLYSSSQDNNIEFGVITNRKKLLGNLTSLDTLENDAGLYFERVIEQSELLYKKSPKFDSKMLGFSKRYTHSEVEKDILSEHFINKINNDNYKKEKIIEKKVSQQYQSQKPSTQSGFCIRTGVPIPFNLNHPMSDAAFTSWKKFSNKEYAENYCHFSGEPSHRETSFLKPILKKNWIKAKDFH